MSERITCMIVDDEQDAIDLLVSNLNDIYPSVAIAGTYQSWKDALTALRAQQPDILFLDISMPGKNGMDMLKLLPVIECEIIFTTAFSEYALDAFQFFATGYLLKPIDDMELASAIEKAVERVRHRRIVGAPSQGQKLGIPNRKGIDYVNLHDILYLESVNKYTKVITAEAELLSPHNIGTFKKLVESDFFFPVHRSYIINVNYMVRYESEGFVIMTDKKEIPVARAVREDFLARFITVTKGK